MIGALKNSRVPEVAMALRAIGLDVFDDWYAAGKHADRIWQRYEKARGRSYIEALYGSHADAAFGMDHAHLCRATTGVLVLPAGRSAYMEAGWLAGRDVPVHVLMEGEPKRWDLMLRFAGPVHTSLESLVAAMGARK